MFQLSQSKPKNVQSFPSLGGAEESSSVAWESRILGAHYLGNCHPKRDPIIPSCWIYKTVFSHELLDSMSGCAKRVANYVKNTVLHSFKFNTSILWAFLLTWRCSDALDGFKKGEVVWEERGAFAHWNKTCTFKRGATCPIQDPTPKLSAQHWIDPNLRGGWS